MGRILSSPSEPTHGGTSEPRTDRIDSTSSTGTACSDLQPLVDLETIPFVTPPKPYGEGEVGSVAAKNSNGIYDIEIILDDGLSILSPPSIPRGQRDLDIDQISEPETSVILPAQIHQLDPLSVPLAPKSPSSPSLRSECVFPVPPTDIELDFFEVFESSSRCSEDEEREEHSTGPLTLYSEPSICTLKGTIRRSQSYPSFHYHSVDPSINFESDTMGLGYHMGQSLEINGSNDGRHGYVINEDVLIHGQQAKLKRSRSLNDRPRARRISGFNGSFSYGCEGQSVSGQGLMLSKSIGQEHKRVNDIPHNSGGITLPLFHGQQLLPSRLKQRQQIQSPLHGLQRRTLSVDHVHRLHTSSLRQGQSPLIRTRSVSEIQGNTQHRPSLSSSLDFDHTHPHHHHQLECHHQQHRYIPSGPNSPTSPSLNVHPDSNPIATNVISRILSLDDYVTLGEEGEDNNISKDIVKQDNSPTLTPSGTPPDTPPSPLLHTPHVDATPTKIKLTRRTSLLRSYHTPPQNLPFTLPPTSPLPSPSEAEKSPKLLRDTFGGLKPAFGLHSIPTSTHENISYISSSTRPSSPEHKCQGDLTGPIETQSEEQTSSDTISSITLASPLSTARPTTVQDGVFMSLDDLQGELPKGHTDHTQTSSKHPLTHHKPNPSVPWSTRTNSTLITEGPSALLSPASSSATSAATTPQTSLQFSNFGKRHSRLTGFSSSSASSSYTSSDTSSIYAKYANGPSSANSHHWGIGEKPDISTVFEEEGSLNELDIELATTGVKGVKGIDEAQHELGVDAIEPQHTVSHPRPLEGSSKHPRAAILGAPIDFTKEPQAAFTSSSRRQPPSTSNKTEKSYNRSDRVQFSNHHHRARPSDQSFQTFPSQRRSERSNTITSEQSGNSTKSARSVHPFASAISRTTSPPPLPRVPHPQHQTRQVKSNPILSDSARMPQQGQLAPAHQVTLASAEEIDDEDTCPVCVESLSFTFRLPGEKPHVVPECGHALHEECFVTVYGDVPPPGTKRTLGVCGVCRQPMRISEGGGRKKGNDKMARLMGQASSSSNTASKHANPDPLGSPFDTASLKSASATDLNGDDPLTNPLAMFVPSTRSLGSDDQPAVFVPSISVRSEYPSISRIHRKGKQAITAVITVNVPTAGNRGTYPARSRPVDNVGRSASGEPYTPFPPSPRSATSRSNELAVPASARSMPSSVGADPFARVLTDLQNRVVNYSTSGLDSLGQLRLFDLLSVRKGTLIREFHVYLFREAIICIIEEKKSAMRKIFSSGSSVRSDHSSQSGQGKGVLKMKGRIYMKHVLKIVDSSIPGELSLTIEMEDPNMDSFILVFKDRGSHETWKRNLNAILEEVRSGPASGYREESAAKIAKMMGAGAPIPVSAGSAGKVLSPTSNHSQISPGMGINFDVTPSGASSYATPATSTTFSPNAPLTGDEGLGELSYAAPLAPVHTPLDLVIILSTPAPHQPGSLPLKSRLMRQSLAFILASMGGKDRISIVACEMGSNGSVRRTPLLNPTRPDSRRKLETFVEQIGNGKVVDDEFEVLVGREERQDVVTAVNTALDVVLQRKVKNPLSGMILISDTNESIKRAQMDLVTARLDAANIPVHAIGYGKGHDPSPLWMISNHTNGTYTFVREWYHLRDTLAGVVGGLMSIAMTNMKLHINCQDHEFKVIKVSGANQAIVSTRGKHADVELRELRHGETRELMVELDFLEPHSPGANRASGEIGSSEGSDESASGPFGTSRSAGNRPRPGTGNSFSQMRNPGSDQGHAHNSSSLGTLGIDNLSVADANAMMYEDVLIDEIPVTEVDCSFHDPAASRSVTRLAHPVLLTTAILPSNAPPSSTPADSLIVRRRMELLASDMITRALLIASRKNYGHAIRILKETRNVVDKITENLQGQLPRHGNGKTRREIQAAQAIEGLGAVLSDVDILVEALEEHEELFERDMRNFAAQQAVVLRTQKSWTTRTPSERMYCTPEVKQLIQLSGHWQAR